MDPEPETTMKTYTLLLEGKTYTRRSEANYRFATCAKNTVGDGWRVCYHQTEAAARKKAALLSKLSHYSEVRSVSL